jgi:TetR/AcrR family transcriptional regulator, transcriptional repressor for nem operon
MGSAMRRSKQATAESRIMIVETASRLFRARGFESVGVADVMQAAGMTHGGFYRHFPSKEALVAEAMAHAFGEAATRLEVDNASPATGTAANTLAVKLGTYVEDYLSTGHVAHPERGCPMAAAGTEAPHAGAGVGASFAQGTEQLAERLSEALRDMSPAPRDAALRLLASLVGTIVIARAVGAGTLQDEVIAAMRADPAVMQALAASS